jgi:hypothetical protein
MARGLGSKHEELHKGQYTYRMVIGKATGDGEQTSMEVIANGDELVSCAQLAYQVLDGRMFQMNQRMVMSMKLLDELPVDLSLKVQRCIEATFGRIPADQIIPPEALKPRRVPTPEEEPTSGEGQS